MSSAPWTFCGQIIFGAAIDYDFSTGDGSLFSSQYVPEYESTFRPALGQISLGVGGGFTSLAEGLI
jgi:hypothetical protein